jgi:FkbM family methyltransferase
MHEEFWERFEKREWEPFTLDVMDELVTPGSMFLDVGAWIGPLSVYALRRHARPVAIEPDPIALDELKHWGVEIIPKALAPFRGMVMIHPRGVWGDSMTRVTDSGLAVETVTIEEIDLSNCSLVNIDVEGYEEELVPVVGPYLAEREIPLLVSLHPQWNTKPVTGFEYYSKVETVGDQVFAR